MMHIVLWVLQIALAVKFASVAVTHSVRPTHPDMQRGAQRFGAAARPLLVAVSVLVLLAAAGLVVPAATGVLAWLTPWAAAVLALLMLVAAGLHRACRERPNIAVSLVLVALAAFVAYGRWVLAPV